MVHVRYRTSVFYMTEKNTFIFVIHKSKGLIVTLIFLVLFCFVLFCCFFFFFFLFFFCLFVFFVFFVFLFFCCFFLLLLFVVCLFVCFSSFYSNFINHHKSDYVSL